MERIIKAQGPSQTEYKLGHLVQDVRAHADGVVQAIDCYRLGRIARVAGAPTDKGAGIDLLKKVGDTVTKGETLYRIYADVEADFRFATRDATREDWRDGPSGVLIASDSTCSPRRSASAPAASS